MEVLVEENDNFKTISTQSLFPMHPKIRVHCRLHLTLI